MKRTKASEPPDPGEVLVRDDLLREIELRLADHEKLGRQIRRLLALARGGVREIPVTEPTPSRKGRKSKCVELSSARR
jgi:hypothetical protein